MSIEKVREAYKKMEWDRTIKEANEVVASDPHNLDALLMLAESYLNKGFPVLGETNAQKALGIDPRHPWAFRVLARAHRMLAEGSTNEAEKKRYLDSAQSEIDRSLAAYTKDPWAYLEKAQISIALDDKGGALEAIDNALALDRHNETFDKVKKSIREMR